MAYKSMVAATSILAAACAGPQAMTLDRFEAQLGANDSATAVLQQWCAVHGIGGNEPIRAVSVTDAPVAEPADMRAILGIEPGEAIGFRHVRLTCGNLVLSEAHNWFVKDRLTQEMNRTLETTDTPFGKVARPLGFTRQRLSSERGPLPACPADTVLAQRALLRLPDGAPLALLVECYTSAIIPAS